MGASWILPKPRPGAQPSGCRSADRGCDASKSPRPLRLSRCCSLKAALRQGGSKVGPGHAKPEGRRPKAEDRIDSHPGQSGRGKPAPCRLSVTEQPIESGHARNSELPPITPMGADNKAGSAQDEAGVGICWCCSSIPWFCSLKAALLCGYRRISASSAVKVFGFQGGRT